MPAAIAPAIGVGGSLLGGLLGNAQNKSAQANNDNQNNIAQQNAQAANLAAQQRIDGFINQNSPGNLSMGKGPPGLNPSMLMAQNGSQTGNPMAAGVHPQVLSMLHNVLNGGAGHLPSGGGQFSGFPGMPGGQLSGGQMHAGPVGMGGAQRGFGAVGQAAQPAQRLPSGITATQAGQSPNAPITSPNAPQPPRPRYTFGSDDDDSMNGRGLTRRY